MAKDEVTMIRMDKSTVKELKRLQLDFDIPNVREAVQLLIKFYEDNKSENNLLTK